MGKVVLATTTRENWKLRIELVAKVLTVHSDWVGHLIICLLFLKYSSCGHFNRDLYRLIFFICNCDLWYFHQHCNQECFVFVSSLQIFTSNIAQIWFQFFFFSFNPASSCSFQIHFSSNISQQMVTRISYRKLPWVVVNRELESTLAHHGWGNNSFLKWSSHFLGEILIMDEELLVIMAEVVLTLLITIIAFDHTNDQDDNGSDEVISKD